MRIISGELGGRRFNPPGNMPFTRPTTDIAKEGLFNIIQNNLDLENIKTLDLFGGTGSISYELFSRGVKELTIVEKDPAMYEFIKKTSAEFGMNDVVVLKSDVFKYISDSNEKFDFIFAGPPYALGNIEDLPNMIFKKQLLNKGGWFILEHTPRNDFKGFPFFRTERKYGTTLFSIFVNKEEKQRRIMTKQEARKVFKQNRAQLSRKDIVKMNDLLLIQFQRLVLPYLNVIHSYIPLQDQKEPDPILMIDFLKFKNVNMKVVYPKINPENFSMQNILEDDNTSFELNKYGIPEPSTGILIAEKEIDLAFVPLIAFDLFGNRVGYGKGYYDRFISKCRFNMIKIGISYFPPLDQIEDIEEFDKKLDFCITPDHIYAF